MSEIRWCGLVMAFRFGICLLACHAHASFAGTVLDSLLDRLPPSDRSIATNPGPYNLQIAYTQVDRDSLNRPSFVHYSFNTNPKQYFYPASLVKLPLAVFALEKIAALKIPGLTRRTMMAIENSCGCPVIYDADDGDSQGRSSIESSIRRMLLWSDNGGYNRLWEFLTRDYLNTRLTQHGYDGIRLLHRLAPCTAQQNATGNPVRFFSNSGNVIYSQEGSSSRVTVFNPCAPVKLGLATMQKGTLVPRPLSADNFNYVALDNIHRFLIDIIFPGSTGKKMPFSLSPSDFRLLRTWMCLLPRESGMPRSAPAASYPDNFKKYLLYGAGIRPVAPDMREFNIVGRAYGFISDVAYFADFSNGVEFFLSVVMYANKDGIVNDDRYDYDSVALPFFLAITSAVYNYELSRPRKHKPDLSGLKPDTTDLFR